MKEKAGLAGGREARRAARSKPKVAVVPYITRKVPVYEIASEETLDLVERNAETIMQEIGIDFRDDPESVANLEGSRC